MRMHVIITVLLLVVTCAGGASGHENCETNELIRKMLGPLLAKTRLSGDRIVRMPRSVSNQAEFFAVDDQWTEAEKREAFDWYLWHLTATAMPVRDGIMQSGNGRNPNPRVWNKHESTRVCKCNCRKHKCMGELPRVF